MWCTQKIASQGLVDTPCCVAGSGQQASGSEGLKWVSFTILHSKYFFLILAKKDNFFHQTNNTEKVATLKKFIKSRLLNNSFWEYPNPFGQKHKSIKSYLCIFFIKCQKNIQSSKSLYVIKWFSLPENLIGQTHSSCGGQVSSTHFSYYCILQILMKRNSKQKWIYLSWIFNYEWQ